MEIYLDILLFFLILVMVIGYEVWFCVLYIVYLWILYFFGFFFMLLLRLKIYLGMLDYLIWEVGEEVYLFKYWSRGFICLLL